MSETIEKALIKLTDYCRKEAYKGYDPYDGLNSTLFQAIPFISKNRLARLAWIQFFKRFPLNLRPVVGVRKDFNPKGLGLFLSGHCNLYKIRPDQEQIKMINYFCEKLFELTNTGYSGACWGYNFDWQAKAFFHPKNTPTVVATTYIGNALLDAYEITGDQKLLRITRSACDFIMNDLNRTHDVNNEFAFSYSPIDQSVIYNASLLGSRLLSRVYSFTGEDELIITARRSVAFCCKNQKNDGSWSYGTLDYHQWVDSFHTGYNLECIADYQKFSGDLSFNEHLNNGFDYYIKTFFTESGIPKYYNNSVFPIDIHAPAQMIITLSRLGKFQENRNLADKVLSWTIKNMQSEEGYFYYQRNKYSFSRIPYMRWAQAWMFYALSEYLVQLYK